MIVSNRDRIKGDIKEGKQMQITALTLNAGCESSHRGAQKVCSTSLLHAVIDDIRIVVFLMSLRAVGKPGC